MATENTTANTATENRPTGADGAANGVTPIAGAGRPSGAAGDVWDALTATPGGTVAAIAAASEVSRATVTRTLTALERDGRAVRARGGWDGGKRLPDVWNAVTPPTDTDTPPTDDAAPTAPSDDAGATATDGATATTDGATATTDGTDKDTEPQDVPQTSPDTDGDTDATDTNTGTSGDDGGPVIDTAAVGEARDALRALGAAIADALTALDGGDGAAALGAVEAVYGGSGRARRLVRAAANGRPRNASGIARSLPGEMRAKVAAHLAAYPGAEFTPHEVGKALGHSAGAVSNALDRLVEAGRAELVCERPRRFTAVPAADSARTVATTAH
ncbi:hypothetical protein GCM10010191_89310 [Actinomadura vinacea]|uniref:HTH iclR-type domain-containing protein n=1 Tax=Actinomadura vinacea TaxID=115336 RepID=A0ABN3KCV6_9ACTN